MDTSKCEDQVELSPSSAVIKVGGADSANPVHTEILKPDCPDVQVTLSKYDLASSATCCRLCGLGVLPSDLKNNSVSEKPAFLPLFVNVGCSSNEERLDHVINRYLPIELSEADTMYPRMICNACHDCLIRTVYFFTKIREGQQLLSKLLNDCSNITPENNTSTFNFNKLSLQPGKRRGRPPKKLIQENVKATATTADIPEIATTVERRTKRQSRPPARYTDQNIINPFKDEEFDDDDFEIKLQKTEAKPVTELEQSSVPNLDFKAIEDTSSFVHSLGSEFSTLETQSENLMDVRKLDIIMDGIDALNSYTTAESTKQDKAVGIGCIKTGTNETNNEEIMPQLKNDDDGSGDDKTVTLKDLIRNRKPTRRRKKCKKQVERKNLPKIQCDKCPKSFSHSSSLVYHRLSVHDKTKNFSCELCGRAFTHKQLLTNHMYVHSEEKYFICESCPAKFKSRASLYTHKKSKHSKVKSLVCDVCGFQTSLKSSLVGHMRIHTGEKPFSCEFCQKAFAQRSNLREHRRTHTGEKLYNCSECSKSFTTSSQLRSHKFSHSLNKPHFLCPTCGKGFSHSENFKYHMRRHTGEGIQCSCCNKQFTDSWALKKHIRTHTKERPYKCFCEKAFADPSNFAKHQKTHIPGPSKSSNAENNLKGEYNTSVNQNHTTKITKDTSTVLPLIETVISTNGNNEGDTDEGQIPSLPLADITVESTNTFITEDAASSIVQILSAENLPYETIVQDDQEVEQVIYVYPDDNTFFTFAMVDGQAVETHASDEIGNLTETGALGAAFESFNSDEIESHYYSLETVGGNTIAVPIQMPQTRNSSNFTGTLNLQPNRLLTGRVAIGVDSVSALANTESPE